MEDAESIIRQHLSSQIVPLSIVAMVVPDGWKVQELMDKPHTPKQYDAKGYKMVTTTILQHIRRLLEDPDVDVRRAAAEALSGLALQLPSKDVPDTCLAIPLQLASNKGSNSKKKSEADQQAEELRITAANLLADLGGAVAEQPHPPSWVTTHILPTVLVLGRDTSFRVRRASAQALPRILAGCQPSKVREDLLPAFDRLSRDELYRVRKSTGECLVDMSRSLVLLAEQDASLLALRRDFLIPIADRLIQDSHKMVRQGMMQFLGPFMASFYPFQNSPLISILPSTSESDGSNHMGIVAQFFPHATSMVSRLNSSQNGPMTSPTPVNPFVDEILTRSYSEMDKLQQELPLFVQAARMSALSLAAVATHRNENLPDPDDVQAIIRSLLDYFAALAIVSTGDESTDAEMRVYCAYSFPAIVLLMGPEYWEGAMKTCFFTLLNPNFSKDNEDEEGTDPPLPVKRCLASSLHTVAHILGPELAASDVLPVVKDYFLMDSDESVRLNVIRNFPALLRVLPDSERREPFLLWSQVVQGEEFLGAKKRSATNPLVLNWRQRDYVARSILDLLTLVDPKLIHDHVWPILKELLKDSVNSVRDDAMWSLPMLLRAYCPENVQKWPYLEDARQFSTLACAEVLDWVKENILKIGASEKARKTVNFMERQLFCRFCAATGLAIRVSEKLASGDEKKDPVSLLGDKVKSLFFKAERKDADPTAGPYQRLSPGETKFLKRLLKNELLPAALEMKEDRISNVRIALLKMLMVMPIDIQESSTVKSVVKELREEMETWENFTAEDLAIPSAPSSPTTSPRQRKKQSVAVKAKSLRSPDSGPVDMDITPDNSDSEEGASTPGRSPRTASTDGGSPRSPRRRRVDSSEYQTVVFKDGPIGMQLEPTKEDRGCRVYGFLDASEYEPSPARASGKINLGDVIVSVNGQVLATYDDTIACLKSGGDREVVFRPATSDDEYEDEYLSGESGEDARRSNKEAKKKKSKKEHKKKDDKKKEKKAKKEKKHKKSPKKEEEAE